ncbi:MAG: response regulator transcription factor [Anaerolineales bacterium]|nr:response regulator transcription factor [Anaerolineales bacterium]
MRLLIVDDVAAVREALRLLLSEEPGIEVVGEAADGAEALARAAALQPDLVLLDLEMPRLGGLAAIPRLRAQPHPPQIVAMSMYGADEARALALAAGASTFVEKGATLQEVVAALRAALPPNPG